MPHDSYLHHVAADGGLELRDFGYPKVANAAALPVLTAAHVGTIYTTQDDGANYRMRAVDDWVIWFAPGVNTAENITGTAALDVTDHIGASAELTMTGDVTALTFSGWKANTTDLQEVLVAIKQDATGGRSFDWSAVGGTWDGVPPSGIRTAAGEDATRFIVSTIDGGATVNLRSVDGPYRDPGGVEWTPRVDSEGRVHVWNATTPPVQVTGANDQAITSVALPTPQVNFSYEFVGVSDRWLAGANRMGLGGQYELPINRAWVLYVEANGTITANGVDDGLTAAQDYSTGLALSDIGVNNNDRLALRGDWDLSGGIVTISIYAAVLTDATAGPWSASRDWVLLGSGQSTGSTGIFSANVPMMVGARFLNPTTRDVFSGTIEGARLTENGTVIASWPNTVATEGWTYGTGTVELTEPSPLPNAATSSETVAVYPHLKETDGSINPKLLTDIATGRIDDSNGLVTDAYFSGGSTGGNKYRLVAAATGADDGGNFIDLTGISTYQLQAVFNGRVTVDQFGADSTFDFTGALNLNNDGVRATANTTAFQAAIDAARFLGVGRVWCEGAGYVLRQVQVHEGIVLTGQPRPATNGSTGERTPLTTLYQLQGELSSPFISVYDGSGVITNDPWGAGLEMLTVTRNDQAAGTELIHVYGGVKTVLRDLRLRFGDKQLVLEGCSDSDFYSINAALGNEGVLMPPTVGGFSPNNLKFFGLWVESYLIQGLSITGFTSSLKANNIYFFGLKVESTVIAATAVAGIALSDVENIGVHSGHCTYGLGATPSATFTGVLFSGSCRGVTMDPFKLRNNDNLSTIDSMIKFSQQAGEALEGIRLILTGAANGTPGPVYTNGVINYGIVADGDNPPDETDISIAAYSDGSTGGTVTFFGGDVDLAGTNNSLRTRDVRYVTESDRRHPLASTVDLVGTFDGTPTVWYKHSSAPAATFTAGTPCTFVEEAAKDNSAGNISLNFVMDEIRLAADTGKYEVSIWGDTEAPAAGDATTVQVNVNAVSFTFFNVDEPAFQVGSWCAILDTAGAAQNIEVDRFSVTGTGRLDVKVRIRSIG